MSYAALEHFCISRKASGPQIRKSFLSDAPYSQIESVSMCVCVCVSVGLLCTSDLVDEKEHSDDFFKLIFVA